VNNIPTNVTASDKRAGDIYGSDSSARVRDARRRPDRWPRYMFIALCVFVVAFCSVQTSRYVKHTERQIQAKESMLDILKSDRQKQDSIRKQLEKLERVENIAMARELKYVKPRQQEFIMLDAERPSGANGGLFARFMQFFYGEN